METLLYKVISQVHLVGRPMIKQEQWKTLDKNKDEVQIKDPD